MTKNSNYTDKDISTNLLVTLKHMKAEYNTFSQEASNEELYEKINEIYECISCQQRTVFDMMCGQGWYQLTADSEKNITKAYNKYNNTKSELS